MISDKIVLTGRYDCLAVGIADTARFRLGLRRLFFNYYVWTGNGYIFLFITGQYHFTVCTINAFFCISRVISLET